MLLLFALWLAIRAPIEHRTQEGIELPPGARVLYAIDGRGQEVDHIDHLGRGVVVLDDVDCDGTSDFIVGSVNGVAGLTQGTGFAQVRSGRDGAMLARVDGRKETTLEFGDGFGIRVGSLCDLDGDGIGEFFVGGEPGIDPPYLNVYSGEKAAVLRTFVSGSADIGGIQDPYDLRTIGDVDGDGRDDLAIVGESKSCVLARGNWSMLDVIQGELVDRSADLDGDGVRDYFCRFECSRPTDAFSAGVLSSKDGSVLAKLRLPERGWVRDWTWSSSGDANGDGYLDAVFLFFEARRRVQEWPAKERRFFAQLISGMDASVLREWWESLEGVGDLNDVRFVGDFDQDGCDDLAIGRYVDQGVVRVLSGKDGRCLARFSAPSTSFGVRVARLGDLDGDGRRDLAIGDHEHGKCAGRVWVISLGKP